MGDYRSRLSEWEWEQRQREASSGTPALAPRPQAPETMIFGSSLLPRTWSSSSSHGTGEEEEGGLPHAVTGNALIEAFALAFAHHLRLVLSPTTIWQVSQDPRPLPP